MNHEQLSKRLAAVADLVPYHARLADIGSDHAYLPCYLALKDKITYAVAGEVVQGPYDLAKQHVAQLNLSQMITVRLADGLQAIEETDNIDTVTICGMGGDLIVSILEGGRMTGKLKTVTKIIAQPNVDEYHVRQWFMKNNYTIDTELILSENGKIYEIIVGVSTNEPVVYTQEQLQFGVYLPLEKSDVFVTKWQSELEKYDKIIASLHHAKTPQTEKIEQFKLFQQKIKEMVSCL